MIILLDIEGTIAPISFVHEVLFPYARQQVEAFLEAHWGHPEVQKDVAGLADPPPATPREAVGTVLQWMDQDRKLGALKSLQGRIWQHGYQQGRLQGQLFTEVAPRLRTWKAAGHRIYIYSSGSVLAPPHDFPEWTELPEEVPTDGPY